MPANEDFPDGEIQPETADPALVRVGTLAWLRQQDTVERDGVTLPACHRVPTDASLAPASESTQCRVVRADGDRCRGTRVLAYGVCMGHAGGGADPATMSKAGTAKLKELRVTREILGIGPRTASSPRAAMRLRAAQRANELARAVIDGPLDADLTPLERQAAALKAVDATFPLQSGTIELSISDDPDSMSWNDMQRLASSLLG
jgi:hypothetical protein